MAYHRASGWNIQIIILNHFYIYHIAHHLHQSCFHFLRRKPCLWSHSWGIFPYHLQIKNLNVARPFPQKTKPYATYLPQSPISICAHPITHYIHWSVIIFHVSIHMYHIHKCDAPHSKTKGISRISNYICTKHACMS